MNILITGATGFIGSHLIRTLVTQYNIYAVGRTSSEMSLLNYKWVNADLSAPDDLVFYELPASIDVIVYLAQSRVYREFPEQANDMFNINVHSVQKMLEFARIAKVKKFIYASTANVYQQSHYPISEVAPLMPQNYYARTKYMAEMLVESYADFFQCVVVRLFTVYGKGQDGMLIPTLIKKVHNRQPIQVQGEAGFKLSPIHVDDVVSVFESLLKYDCMKGFEILNVGGHERLNILKIGTSIGSTLGIPPAFEFVVSDEPAGWLADITKLQNTLKIPRFLTFAEGLKKTIDPNNEYANN